MSILDMLKRGKVASGGSQQVAQVQAQPGAAVPQQPLTMAQLLAQLEEQRPALEERFQSDAILFAANLRSARKIFPEAEARVAYQWLTARCDDAQIGGTVLFFQRNADGQEVEVQGTRVQQLENFYAEALPHSLADERVAAVRAGRTQALALPAGGHHAAQAAATGAPSAQSSSFASAAEVTEEQALASTSKGQDILAKRKATTPAQSATTTAPGSSAVN